MKDDDNPTTIIIGRIDAEWLFVRFPYDEDFINEMKDSIVSTFRRWDPINRYWHVHTAFLESLIPICKEYFDHVKVENSLLELDQSKIDDGVFDKLFPLIRDLYVDKVYIALAQAFHPDHEGDTELMKQLNAAYHQRKASKVED